MELENAYNLVFDDVILYGAKSNLKITQYNDLTMKINWCVLKSKPDELICLNFYNINTPYLRDELTDEIFDRKLNITVIDDLVIQKLQEIIKDEINKFVEKNIDNKLYFFNKEEKVDFYNQVYYERPEFLVIRDMGIDILHGFKGIDKKAKALTMYTDYTELNKGILLYKNSCYDNQAIKVDLVTKEILTSPSELLSMFYSKNDLKKILAYEQYKRGLTPKFYNEIAKINNFLKEKKTVVAVFKNGYETKTEANVSNIIDFSNGVFSIYKYLIDYPKDESEKMNEISNLKSLKYGRKELIIDTDNLSPLDEQLDEIIENKENNLLNYFEEEELNFSYE